MTKQEVIDEVSRIADVTHVKKTLLGYVLSIAKDGEQLETTIEYNLVFGWRVNSDTWYRSLALAICTEYLRLCGEIEEISDEIDNIQAQIEEFVVPE